MQYKLCSIIFIFSLVCAIFLLGACEQVETEDEFEPVTFRITGYIDETNQIKKMNEIYGLHRNEGTSVYSFNIESVDYFNEEIETWERIVNAIVFSARRKGKTILDTNDKSHLVNGKLTINIISNRKAEVYYNSFKCICENYSLKSKLSSSRKISPFSLPYISISNVVFDISHVTVFTSL